MIRIGVHLDRSDFVLDVSVETDSRVTGCSDRRAQESPR